MAESHKADDRSFPDAVSGEDRVLSRSSKSKPAGGSRKAKSASGRRPKRGRRWFIRIFFALIAIALVPVGLTALALVPQVHPVSTLMIADLLRLKGYEREWVSLDEMAPVLPRSVMMSEDGQFCRHYGVDLGELKVVVEDALDGEKTRGASTIPMQLVKNLFLWPSRSFVRKGIEIPYAVSMNAILPKRRIMEIYLNVVELGDGIYGVEAASQHYFGRSAAKLSAEQAARLAATLPNPAERNPEAGGPGTRKLARLIQRRAAKSGAYTKCLELSN
ncbi:monofunctional biosynthetic peptidoglycan transglycosylase [Notoacmeibacter sp. MSK16QG-6]|uniref:monofunctional biosynthetic peptidoglycan transglycosylase n=1 Tax=Notoacmeibacter sp. MSK16QG-6 TaxID=2957982 RepID=UPI0020A071FF|nr:monofunctional biosynthetic peptidoglycan transglycosylase [Notoacmeibacter sp. MSK16QG-6]